MNYLCCLYFHYLSVLFEMNTLKLLRLNHLPVESMWNFQVIIIQICDVWSSMNYLSVMYPIKFQSIEIINRSDDNDASMNHVSDESNQLVVNLVWNL